MNTLKGKITQLNSTENLSLVSVSVGAYLMSAIIIDTPETTDYLKKGAAIELVFKETEVIISTGNGKDISLRNQIPGHIEAIDSGPLLSKVMLKTDVGMVTAVITTNAVQSLDLSVGKEAIAMIKTNEIMLAY